MKRAIQLLTASILLGALTLQADPNLTVDFISPTEYANNNPIPASDTLTYALHCNDVPGQIGTPYEVEIGIIDPSAPPSVEDFAPVVNGQPGEYTCAATATSTAFGATSGYSAETNFTVTSGQLGFVPKAPTNLTIILQ